MDTLALGIIAIGLAAAIGVVLVAMSDKGDEAAAARGPAPATHTTPEHQSPSRPRRRPQQARPRTPRPQAAPVPVAVPVVPAPRAHSNGYAPPTAAGDDPLVAGFLQVMTGEMHTLRQQQEDIEQRLKMIDGMAALINEMHTSRLTRARHASPASSRTGSRPVSSE